MNDIFSIAVIGSGSAGVMAALRAVLNNDQCVLFTGTGRDRKRSRAMWVTKVENMPAHFNYKKAIEEPNQEVLDWISKSPFSSNLVLKKNIGIQNVTKREDGIFVLQDSNGDEHLARFVVLCTGVMDVQPLINNQISPAFPFANMQSMDYCLRCDGHHVFGKQTAVIGHTVGAAWVTIMLYERYRCPGMYILTNGEAPNFDQDTTELLEMYGIKVHTSAIEKILGDVKAGRLAGFTLKDGMSLHAEMAFVSLGMIVYNELALKVGAQVDARGFVVTDAQGLSSVPGFYVAGDVMAGTKKQIYTAWDTAVNALDAINQKLRASRRADELKKFRENVKSLN